MKNNVDETPSTQERFADVFSHLQGQDIENFYTHYQIWVQIGRAHV